MSQSESNNKWKWLQTFIEPTSALLITLLSLVISIPIFVTLYHLVPPIRISLFGGIRIEYIVLELVLFFVLFILIKRFEKMFFLILLCGFAGLGISSLIGGYSFNNLYYDYSAIVYNLSGHLQEYDFKEEQNSFRNKEEIRAAINETNPLVKEKANVFAVANFKDYQYSFPSKKVLHCFSIFKEVNHRWNYVYDPQGPDYYSKTSQTLEQMKDDDLLKGDCDDYSILMAGLMKAVGAEVRLVRTEIYDEDRTIGHLYPELKIGDEKDLERIAYFIQNELFIKESKGKNIFYYIDGDGAVWLNMDYNDDYPGGPYQSMVRKSILPL